MLEALDGITAILDGLDRTGLEPAGDDKPLIAALEALATGAVEDDSRKAPVATTRPAEPAAKASRQGEAMAPAARLGRIDEITTGLQEGVEEARLERIGAAWSQLPRLVRHLAIELDKPMELQMHGAEIEIDRRLIEPIQASLVHLVRNAADHGLEGRAERRRRGKREKGRIAVDARRRADRLVIEVCDDGRGLDSEQITRAAVTSRLGDPADAAAITSADCRQLIFQPGFSTAETVTPVSGRGVGLDAVREGIERLGGTIQVCSVPGRGAAFALQIPCTPAKATAGSVATDEKGRASLGAKSVDAGSKGQRTKPCTAKRTATSRRRAPCRQSATACTGRRSVLPAPSF
jgi:chemotaxis protein histidine kinase CheA